MSEANFVQLLILSSLCLCLSGKTRLESNDNIRTREFEEVGLGGGNRLRSVAEMTEYVFIYNETYLNNRNIKNYF